MHTAYDSNTYVCYWCRGWHPDIDIFCMHAQVRLSMNAIAHTDLMYMFVLCTYIYMYMYVYICTDGGTAQQPTVPPESQVGGSLWWELLSHLSLQLKQVCYIDILQKYSCMYIYFPRIYTYILLCVCIYIHMYKWSPYMSRARIRLTMRQGWLFYNRNWSLVAVQ